MCVVPLRVRVRACVTQGERESIFHRERERALLLHKGERALLLHKGIEIALLFHGGRESIIVTLQGDIEHYC